MVAIPENDVKPEDLIAWYTATQELQKAKAREILLRLKIFKFYFPTPKEGTNTFILPDDYQLKGVHVISRDIDIAAAKVLSPKFAEEKIAVDKLIEWKPSLKVGEYRELTAEQVQLFDQCLIVKNGTPSLKIEPPSKKKGKAGETSASNNPS